MPQALKDSQYDGFTATRAHVQSNGLSIMPTAGVYPAAAQAVALHGGLGYDVVVMSIVRRGEPPMLATPISKNPNRVYLTGGRWGSFPIYDLGGTSEYIAGVWFVWGLLVPEAMNSPFYLGSLPFPGADTNEYIGTQYFSATLINGMVTQTMIPVPAEPSLLAGIISKG